MTSSGGNAPDPGRGRTDPGLHPPRRDPAPGRAALPADADNPAGILATLAAGLAPGSFVAVSHLTSDFAPAAVTSGVAAYNEAVPGGITARSHAQVSALLGDLSLVPPGVVPVSEWRPDPGLIRQPADLYAVLAATRPSDYQCGWTSAGSNPHW